MTTNKSRSRMPSYAGQHVFCSRLQSIECTCSLMQFSVCVALLYGHFDIAAVAHALPKLLTNPMCPCGK